MRQAVFLGSGSRDVAVPGTGSSDREDGFTSDVFPSRSRADEPQGLGESAATL